MTDLTCAAKLTVGAKDFKYENLHIGGGGYVTGMVIHPKAPDIKYIRTDVGGAYKWDAENKKWLPITEFFSSSERLMYNIDGIAIDPNNKDILYLCCGDGGKPGSSALYRSTDRGESFQKTGLVATFLGNANYRQDGEPIMVDPNNSDVIYCGTRREGLMVSQDGGETWGNISDVPLSAEERGGVRSVAVDATEIINGRSKTVYATVAGDAKESGVYESHDGGVSFSLLKGIPSKVRRISVSKQGVLYATTSNGVYKYENGKVTDISPEVDKRTYRALAVSADGEKIIVAHANTGAGDCMNMKIYYSSDKGESWKEKTENKIKENKTSWWPEYFFSSATASLIFEPDNSKEVWFTDWYGVWKTMDITSEKTVWRLEDAGHEEAVVTDILSNKEGDAELVTAMVDNGGMYYTDVSKFPDARHSDNATCLDFCESEPRYVVASENNNAGTIGLVKISDDYGKTYTKTTYTGTAVRIAQNTKDFRNFVVLPINEAPKYTTDSGKTWHSSSGVPANTITTFWGAPRALCSDRFSDGVFYILSGGAVYKSTDGGKTFLKTCDLKCRPGTVKANPFAEGEVYVCAGKDGLYISKDEGGNFERVSEVTDAASVSFGPDKDKNGYVSYLLGTVKGKTGLFMSEDGFKTFIQLNDEETNKLGKADFITADRRVYGRVFIGTDGRGIITASYIK